MAAPDRRGWIVEALLIFASPGGDDRYKGLEYSEWIDEEGGFVGGFLPRRPATIILNHDE